MTGPASPTLGYRVLFVSIRQDCYLHGNTSSHPVDITDIPGDVGTRFTSLDAIERWVPQALRGITSYWQVRVIDDTGTVVRLGFRAGYNGTGNTWTWRPPTPSETSREATA